MAHETPEDLQELQRLLDRSHAAAGSHLKSIFSDERRVTAAELPERLTGVQVTALATVTAKGEPRVAPVDGLFYRGHLWFGSSHESMRFRHIRARPAVSATVTHGESFAVVLHGTAVEVDPRTADDGGFLAYLKEIYGPQWEDWYPESPPYARIEPDRIFTFGGVGDAAG